MSQSHPTHVTTTANERGSNEQKRHGITAASRQHRGSITAATQQRHDSSTDTATTTARTQRRQRHSHSDDSSTDTTTTATRTHRRQQHGHSDDSSSRAQARSKPKQSTRATASRQIDSITTERQRGKSKNGCKTNVYSPRKFSATQKISSLVQKIQGNVSAKSIQISRYTRLYNNMRHQCTHEEFTIDDDAPTTSEDVTLRQEIYPVGRISMSMVPSKISSTNTWKF